jgi:hypothetical protein
MCHYITATLSQKTDLEKAGEVFERFKLGFEVIHNPHIESQLPAGERYILTTRKYCDCGTALGSLSHSFQNGPPSYEREVQKFRKQGWSEAKIKRWLTEKETAHEKANAKSQRESGSEDSTVVSWVEFLTVALASGHTDRIGILLHWYQGSLTSERITLKNIVSLPIGKLTPEYLLKIEEDSLYTFAR